MITFILGDSITEGLWDSKSGWADRIKSYVQAEEGKSGIKNHNKVYNLGLASNTTKQLVAGFESEVEVRLRMGQEYAFTFAIGINDTTYRNNQGFEIKPEQYKDELTTVNQTS